MNFILQDFTVLYEYDTVPVGTIHCIITVLMLEWDIIVL